MSVSRRVLIPSLIALPVLDSVAGPVLARARRRAAAAARRVSVTVAIDRQGRATPQWIALIRDRIDANELAGVQMTARALSADDAHWIKLVQSVSPDWIRDAGRLDAPFRQGTPPATIAIFVGPEGGDDAFATAPNLIAFDLTALGNAFGNSDPAGWPALVGRLLSREYTRLRLDAHLADAGWTPQWAAKSPFLAALRTLYVQGLATLRGLEGDPAWVAADGTPSAVAGKLQDELVPVMLEKLKALSTAQPGPAADALLRDMTQGPLSRRWGVLPIALWLTADTGFDAGRIAAWVEGNPDGILELAAGQADDRYRRAFADLQAAVADKVAAQRQV